MSFKKLNGKCLCGSVSVSFTTTKDTFASCHCGMCRKWAGSSALAVEAEGDVVFQGDENIQVYSSSDWAERGFCRRCGTHLFYRLKAGGFINFPLGLIDNGQELKFDLQIFIDKKPKHYNFAEKTATMTEAEVLAKFGSGV